MDELAKRAQRAEKEFLDSILELFKRNPNACFTANDIIKELGIISGYNKRYAHSHLTILKWQGELVKVAQGKGFKYKHNTSIAS